MFEEDDNLCTSCKHFLAVNFYSDLGGLCVHCQHKLQMITFNNQMKGVVELYEQALQEKQDSIDWLKLQLAEQDRHDNDEVDFDKLLYKQPKKVKMTPKKVKETLALIEDPSLRRYISRLIKHS